MAIKLVGNFVKLLTQKAPIKGLLHVIVINTFITFIILIWLLLDFCVWCPSKVKNK